MELWAGFYQDHIEDDCVSWYAQQNGDPMYFLMTNDVEAHSLSLNREDPGTVDQVHKVGLPRLLDLLSKHDVSSTFYFTGMFAEASPESVELVRDHGHETRMPWV